MTPGHVFVVTTRLLHCLASQLQQRVYVEIRTRGHGCSILATRTSYRNFFASSARQSQKANQNIFLCSHSKLCELRRVNRGAHLLSLTTLKFHPGEENSRRLAVIGQEIARASHRKSSSTATVSEGVLESTSLAECLVIDSVSLSTDPMANLSNSSTTTLFATPGCCQSLIQMSGHENFFRVWNSRVQSS